MGGKEKEKKAYRDLNEPEGWSVSILRKILLLRFRRDTFDHERFLYEKGRSGEGEKRQCDRTILRLGTGRKIP